MFFFNFVKSNYVIPYENFETHVNFKKLLLYQEARENMLLIKISAI